MTGKPPILALERDYQRTILDAAQLLKLAHRPLPAGPHQPRLAHPRRRRRQRLPPTCSSSTPTSAKAVSPRSNATTGHASTSTRKRGGSPLIAAGFIHDVVLVPSGLDGYVKTLHDVATSRSRT